jgi:hypothetical protein
MLAAQQRANDLDFRRLNIDNYFSVDIAWAHG